MATDTDTKPTGLALLRVPFLPNQISKLPKPTAKREVMDKLDKATCKICGGYHATSKVIHLDYVGHAALTDRLLDADPNWNWEPMAVDASGLPLYDKNGGLWIKLTVCGVTRLGYGHADGKSGGDAIKEIVGDAIRNSGMRFGAALDLWHKGDLHADPDDEDGRKKAAKDKASESDNLPPKQKPQGKPAVTVSEAQKKLYDSLAETYHGNLDEMADALRTYSSFTPKPTEANPNPETRWLKLADLEHGNDNEKFQRWVGAALSEYRKDSGAQPA